MSTTANSSDLRKLLEEVKAAKPTQQSTGLGRWFAGHQGKMPEATKARVYNWDPDVDSTTGVPHLGFRTRFGGLVNDREREAYLDKTVGPEGWALSQWGDYSLTPQGQARLGVPVQDRATTIEDKGSVNRYDVAEYIARHAPGLVGTVSGAAAGSLYGAGAGLGGAAIGAIAGSGLGGWAGELLQNVPRYLYGDRRESVGESLERADEIGRLSAGGEMLHRGILRPVGRFLVAPGASKVSPLNLELAKIGKEKFGVSAHAYQVKKSKIGGRLYSIAHRVLGDDLEQFNRNKMVDALNNLRGGDRHPAMLAQKTGARVQQNLRAFNKAKSQWADKAYAPYRDLEVDTTGIKSALEAQKGRRVFAATEDKADDIDQMLFGGDRAYLLEGPEAEVKKEGRELFTNLESFFRDVTDLPDTMTRDQWSTVNKRMYQLHQQALQGHHPQSDVIGKVLKASREVGEQHAAPGSELAKINETYREMAELTQDALIERARKTPSQIGSVPPEDIMGMFLGKEKLTKAQRLFAQIPAETKRNLGDQFSNKLVNDSLRRGPQPGEYIFNPQTFLQKMDSYGDDVLDLWLGKDLKKAMYEWGEVAQLLKLSDANAGGLIAASIGAHPIAMAPRIVYYKFLKNFVEGGGGFKYLTGQPSMLNNEITRAFADYTARGIGQSKARGAGGYLEQKGDKP